MKFIPWLFLALALVITAGLARMVLESGNRNAQGLWQSAQGRIQRTPPDYTGAIDELGIALRMAQEDDDTEWIAKILRTRADLRRRLGAYVPARADYDTLIAMADGEPTVDHWLALCEIEHSTGNFDEGLRLASQVLDVDPESAEGLGWRGRMLVGVSDAKLAECRSLLQTLLLAPEFEEAKVLVHRLTAMAEEDPLRVSVLHRLRELIPEQHGDRARTVIELAREAAAEVALARESLARSFELEVSPRVGMQFLKLLQRAGLHYEAIDFGLALSTFPRAAGDLDLLKRVAVAMDDLGRPSLAVDFIDRRFNRERQPDSGFYSLWAEVLFKSERWGPLVAVARNMRAEAEDEDRQIANFYLGIARMRSGHPKEAADELERYLRIRNPKEPIPNALAIAWSTLGRAAGADGRPLREREGLQFSTQLDPNYSGEDWLRLSELYADDESNMDWALDIQLAQALRLLPERSEEILARWREVGERLLANTSTYPELIADRMSRGGGRCFPPDPSGPWELFRLAEVWAERGNHGCAVTTLNELLEGYPGMLPALDMLAESYGALGDWGSVANVLTTRLAQDGGARETVERLLALPDGSLSPAQTLELMALDPEGHGRLLIARELRAQGQQQRALDGLLSLGLDELGDEGRLLAGELYLDLGRHRDAVTVLGGLPSESPLYSEALLLHLDAAGRAGRRQRIAQIIEQLRVLEDIDAEELVRACEVLWREGLLEDAHELLSVLDADEGTRSSDGMIALGITGLLSRDSVGALEAFDRAEAFRVDGTPELGRVMLLVDDRNWSHLPATIRDLLHSDLELGDIEEAALTLLSEEFESGDVLAQAGLRMSGRDARWWLLAASSAFLRGSSFETTPDLGPGAPESLTELLHGVAGERRFPRQTLALLLCLEKPQFRAFAEARLRPLVRRGIGGGWTACLLAHAAMADGRLSEAAQELRKTLETHPDFAPAWELLEWVELERNGRDDHPNVLRVRGERRAALGSRAGEEAEELYAQALVLDAAGNHDRALERVASALAVNPKLHPARSLEGRLLHRTGRHGEALEAFRSLFRSLTPELAAEELPGYLDFLLEAHRMAPAQVSQASLEIEFESLSSLLPLDPLIPLAQARAELATSGAEMALRVQRAFEILHEFRDARRDSTVEGLRPGCALEWAREMAALDPTRAESFLRSELESHPGNLDLWIELGSILEAGLQFQEAIEHNLFVLRMMPDAPTRQRLVSLLAAYGTDIDLLETNITALEGMKQRTPASDLNFWRAQARVHHGDKLADEGIRLLEKLLETPARIQGTVTRAQIAQLYGTALVQRGRSKDAEAATQALELAMRETVGQPVRHSMVTALRNLAKNLGAGRKPAGRTPRKKE